MELELAVSSVMGSGLFICCVSLAGVLFVKGIGITDRCCSRTCDIALGCYVHPTHPDPIGLKLDVKCRTAVGRWLPDVHEMLITLRTPCRKAFVRDVAAYLIASAVTLVLLWDGAFARYEAIVQILLYMLYLSICVYTSRCAIGNPVDNATLWVCASQPS